MIVNAICHRNYMDNSCVQVAVYDDRVEVTSPGMMYGGLTLQEAMSGRSKIRNKAIAEVLSRMEIVESWGTGIRRIMNRAKEYGLPEPEFLEMGDTFRVNLFRVQMNPEMNPEICPIVKDIELTMQQRTVLELIRINPKITRQEIAKSMNKSLSTVKRNITVLRDAGLVDFNGNAKTGEWVVKGK